MENTDPTGKKVTLVVTTIASFVSPFLGSSISVALPAIGEEFSMGAVLLSWVASSYLIAAAMVLVPVGRIADIHGRKRIFSYGLLVYTLSSFLCASAFSGPFLIAFRLLQGVGGAMIFGVSVAILTAAFPAGERGRVLGINVASVYVGLSAGPFIGGLLTEHFGWRSVFMIHVPLGLICLALVLSKMKGEWAEFRGARYDHAGAVLYMAAIAALMYGLSSLTRPLGISLFLSGIVLMALFVLREGKLRDPLLHIGLFRHNAAFAFSNLAALISYSATFAVTFLLSLYLQYVKGLSPVHTGTILVAQPAVQALFSPSAGKLSDRIEPRIVASFGMGLTALGLGLLLFLDGGTTVPFIVTVLFILGLGFAFFSSPNTNAIMSSVENQFYGVASGTLATMRLTGQMLSMAIVMMIFTLHIGDAVVTPQRHQAFMESMHGSFVIFSILCFAAIFASLARGKIR